MTYIEALRDLPYIDAEYAFGSVCFYLRRAIARWAPEIGRAENLDVVCDHVINDICDQFLEDLKDRAIEHLEDEAREAARAEAEDKAALEEETP